MPDHSPAPESVDSASLVKLLVNAGDCGHIQNGIPANILPDVRDRDDRPEIFALREEQDRIVDDPEADKHLIDDALAAEAGGDNTRHNDPGNKVRQIGDRLRHALELRAPQFVKKQRQNNRSDKPDGNVQAADDKRIADDVCGILAFKEGAEVVEAHKAIPGQVTAGNIIEESV